MSLGGGVFMIFFGKFFMKGVFEFFGKLVSVFGNLEEFVFWGSCCIVGSRFYVRGKGCLKLIGCEFRWVYRSIY